MSKQTKKPVLPKPKGAKRPSQAALKRKKGVRKLSKAALKQRKVELDAVLGKLNALRNRYDEDDSALRNAMAAVTGQDQAVKLVRFLTGQHPVIPADQAPGRITARFDVAQTTDDNSQHWAMADGLGPNAAASAGVRRIIRNRSRYEEGNNCYCRGMMLTLANDVIGNGARLQLRDVSESDATFLEREFQDWCDEIGLADKLRLGVIGRLRDGESIGKFQTNEGLSHPVKLDVTLIEPEQLQHPWDSKVVTGDADGITYDAWGNPSSYFILKMHPGESPTLGGKHVGSWEFDNPPASHVMHWFRQDRPGQLRGLPEIMPALPLFAQLRRWTLACLLSAETAANQAILLETEMGVDTGQAAIWGATASIPVQANMAMAIPAGYHASQFKPEQPSTTYDPFKRELLSEIGRCVNVPYVVAACDSSDSSFASGRLDHQVYFRQLSIYRKSCELKLLHRIFRAWWEEAVLIAGPNGRHYLPQVFRQNRLPRHEWLWGDGHEYGNRQQDANAKLTELQSGMTTHAIEYAKRGLDWRQAFEAEAKILGKSYDEYVAMVFGNMQIKPPAIEANTDEPAEGEGKKTKKAAAKTPAKQPEEAA